MRILHFCFIILNLLYQTNAISVFSDIESFYKWFHAASVLVDDALDLYDEFSDDPLHVNAQEKRLFDNLRNVTLFINRVETNIPQVTIAKFNQLERDFSQIIHFEIKLDYLVKQIDRIEDSYQTFLCEYIVTFMVHESVFSPHFQLSRVHCDALYPLSRRV